MWRCAEQARPAPIALPDPVRRGCHSVQQRHPLARDASCPPLRPAGHAHHRRRRAAGGGRVNGRMDLGHGRLQRVLLLGPDQLPVMPWRRRADHSVKCFHALLGTTVPAPAHHQVLPLPAEFISPSAGAEMPDCERSVRTRAAATSRVSATARVRAERCRPLGKWSRRLRSAPCWRFFCGCSCDEALHDLHRSVSGGCDGCGRRTGVSG